MHTEDFTIALTLGAAPAVVFEAVLDPRAWWSRDIEGKTRRMGDEFTFRVPGAHVSRQRIVELVPQRRVVWLVTESQLGFVEDPAEWTGTRIVFAIHPTARGTRLTFTHEGLRPALECHGACSSAWTAYIDGSLRALVLTGTGTPNLE